MFQNLFGSVSRFLQRFAPAQRGTTPQGQAKLDAQATNKGQPMSTPQGQAKLDANRQGKQPEFAGKPFAKPMGEGKGYAQKP